LIQAPVDIAIEHDGLRIAALDWGGDGEPLLLLHPNGFCAGLFDPMARALRDTFRPIGVDLRAHGGTDEPPAVDGYAYEHMARDVLAVLDALGVPSVVALGESLGGGVPVVHDRVRPGILRRFELSVAIAIDTYSPGPGRPGGNSNHMSEIARKRRPVWPDRETMVRSYGSRPPLNELAPEALEAYIRWGTVERADGTVELACRPEAEATIFEVTGRAGGAPDAWSHLASLQADATVLAGTRSDLPVEWFRGQAERARCPFVPVDGGHFFLQEDTARAAALVRDSLDV
jgi:pimeloyl-ACP methyl ester carboxylesterase